MEGASRSIASSKRSRSSTETSPDLRSAKFFDTVTQIFDAVKREVHGGATASYIPILAAANPDCFSVSICTVDGKQFSVGDSDALFSMQSCATPLSYAITAEDRGLQTVHRYVGYSPSGTAFNDVSLDYENKPWNPFLNAGAITVASLMAPGLDNSARFRYFIQQVRRFAGHAKVGFSHSTYLCEQETAWRNKALVAFMMSQDVFPHGVNASEALDMYLQCCSVEVNTQAAANIAATLANQGVCPLTGETVVSEEIVTATTSLLFSCGMYDYSGRWMSDVQLPSKSGVSGLIYVVIPRVMGIAIYSPPLDAHGNSVRGVEFCKRLVAAHGLGVFDRLVCHAGQPIRALSAAPAPHSMLQSESKTYWRNVCARLVVLSRKYRMLRRLAGFPSGAADLEDLIAAIAGAPPVDPVIAHLKAAIPSESAGLLLQSSLSAHRLANGHDMLAALRAYLAVVLPRTPSADIEAALKRALQPNSGRFPVASLAAALAWNAIDTNSSYVQSRLDRMRQNSVLEMPHLLDTCQHGLQGCPILAYFTQRLAINSPTQFRQECHNLFDILSRDTSGEVSKELQVDEVVLADPDSFAVCIVTVHGQVFEYGDVRHDFPLLGTGRGLMHMLAAHDNGNDVVDQWCGEEPTAAEAATFSLMPADQSDMCDDARGRRGFGHPKPWNPYLESGSLVTAALIGRAHHSPAQRMFHDNGTRFSHIMNSLSKWAGGRKIGFNNSVFLAQKEKRLKTLAISYFLKGMKALPAASDPVEVAHVLFQAEALEMNVMSLGCIAGLLANAGTSPISRECCVKPEVVRDVLSGMYSCGLGLLSGKAMFTTGVPCATGISGAMIAVVPGLLGMCIYSPRVNQLGVPPRAVRFVEELSHAHGYSIFQRLTPQEGATANALQSPPISSPALTPLPARDLAVSQSAKAFDFLHTKVMTAQQELRSRMLYDLCHAASRGDVKYVLDSIRDGVDVNAHDYDMRTALHVAAADGQLEVVQVLIALGADASAKDRRGRTALDDAAACHHDKVAEFLSPVTRTEATNVASISLRSAPDIKPRANSGLGPELNVASTPILGPTLNMRRAISAISSVAADLESASVLNLAGIAQPSFMSTPSTPIAPPPDELDEEGEALVI